MARYFFIQLASDPDAEVHWLAPGSNFIETGTLAEAARRTEGRPALVLVPGLDVTLTRVRLPSQRRQRLLKAIPYALEEQVADEVDELHFAMGGRGPDDQVAVAVVARDKMQSWVSALREAGIQPRALVVETLALPWSEGEWSVYADGACMLMRTGAVQGFAADLQSAELLLRLACQGSAVKPDCVRFLGYTTVTAPEPDLGGVQRVVDERPRLPLLRMAAALGDPRDPGRSVDLLQGEFSTREQLGRVLRPWRAPAVLLVLLVGLWGGTLVAEQRRLQQEARELSGTAEQILRATFPGIGRVVDPRVQMERQLSALRAASTAGGSGFTGMISGVGRWLAGDSATTLRSFAYRESRLDLELTTGDLQRLDALKQTIARETGIEVEIVSARNEESKVEARLRMTRPGA